MQPPKPTRAAGGGRKPLAISVAQAVLKARCLLFPAGHYPGPVKLSGALGISRQKFGRFLQDKAALTPEQLAAGHALLDAAAPWAQKPPATDFDEASAAR